MDQKTSVNSQNYQRPCFIFGQNTACGVDKTQNLDRIGSDHQSDQG